MSLSFSYHVPAAPRSEYHLVGRVVGSRNACLYDKGFRRMTTDSIQAHVGVPMRHRCVCSRASGSLVLWFNSWSVSDATRQARSLRPARLVCRVQCCVAPPATPTGPTRPLRWSDPCRAGMVTGLGDHTNYVHARSV